MLTARSTPLKPSLGRKIKAAMTLVISMDSAMSTPRTLKMTSSAMMGISETKNPGLEELSSANTSLGPATKVSPLAVARTVRRVKTSSITDISTNMPTNPATSPQ